jgi:hypothetical protein
MLNFIISPAEKNYKSSILKKRILTSLKKQGYTTSKNGFVLNSEDRETKRKIHESARKERLIKNTKFIKTNVKLATKYLLDGKKINIDKIEPKLILIKPNTKYDILFRWWNLVWWSLPYEKAYGRQMRYLIWDKFHNSPMGLIGLQSPILSWNVRDKYLKISPSDRDFWVNQSLSAQRLGALPPYNYLLGGKLIASLMTTVKIRKDFEKKYKNKKTLMKKRDLPARLLFITTTGAYGKSSVYTKLKFGEEKIAKFIGYSKGNGSFHIPNSLYEELIKYLAEKKYKIGRGYGNGPSRKLKLIDNGLQSLGIMNGSLHGVKRAVYLFPFTSNLEAVISNKARPVWNKRSVEDITDFWKEKWAKPKAKKDITYLSFNANKFINEFLETFNNYE